MYLRVTLAQLAPVLGNVRQNLEKHVSWITEHGPTSDLIIFPELSLSGYLLYDLVPDIALRPHDPDDFVFRELGRLSEEYRVDLVVGFVEEDRRHRYYTAAAYIHRGHLLHVHRKVYLPTYGLFLEGRDLAPGDSVRAFDAPWGRTGMLICEDFWHASPPYILWLDGADVFIHHSASPGRGLRGRGKLDSSRFVEEVNQTYAALFTVYVLHCNRAGIEDGINFWGGSAIYGPDGTIIAQAPYFEEYSLQAEINLKEVQRVRQRLPLLRDERPELLMREVHRILHARGAPAPFTPPPPSAPPAAPSTRRS